jgi:hypothetical protein
MAFWAGGAKHTCAENRVDAELERPALGSYDVYEHVRGSKPGTWLD